MKQKASAQTRALALLLALLLALGAFSGCSGTGGKSSAAPDKTITLTVVHKDGSSKDFTVETSAENLGDALEQEGLIQGEESEYGLFVKTVDGETADDAKEEWWCLTDKDGNMTPTGVDSTPIADGEAYTFTLTVGYDS